MSRRPDFGGRWWREPLVHFLVIGALLFVAFDRWGAGGAGTARIVLTPGQIDALASGFARTWQRPPTEEELKGLLDEHVREEIATREAMSLGLDRDDTVIRRRLRQKFEFIAEDSIDATPPTEADLQRWLDTHPADFRREPEVAFRQVYLSPDRRGAALERDATALLAQLTAAGATASIEEAGDPLMLPREVPPTSLGEVGRQFGEPFAAALGTAPLGAWSGPVRSGYGLHLVFVRTRTEGQAPRLEEVLPVVSREFTADRRKRQLDRLYETLLDRYRVVIERRAAPPVDGRAGSSVDGRAGSSSPALVERPR
jgi:hypothetical protein